MSTGAPVDLSALRTARHEANGARRVFVLDGEEFEGPIELPLSFPVAIGDNDVREALRILFGDRAERFLELGGTTRDLEAITLAYRVNLGEVSASSTS